MKIKFSKATRAPHAFSINAASMFKYFHVIAIYGLHKAILTVDLEIKDSSNNSTTNSSLMA